MPARPSILLVGARLANPDLADMMERFAADGPQAFYAGEVGQAIVGMSLIGIAGAITAWRERVVAKRKRPTSQLA